MLQSVILSSSLLVFTLNSVLYGADHIKEHLAETYCTEVICYKTRVFLKSGREKCISTNL